EIRPQPRPVLGAAAPFTPPNRVSHDVSGNRAWRVVENIDLLEEDAVCRPVADVGRPQLCGGADGQIPDAPARKRLSERIAGTSPRWRQLGILARSIEREGQDRRDREQDDDQAHEEPDRAYHGAGSANAVSTWPAGMTRSWRPPTMNVLGAPQNA